MNNISDLAHALNVFSYDLGRMVSLEKLNIAEKEEVYKAQEVVLNLLEKINNEVVFQIFKGEVDTLNGFFKKENSKIIQKAIDILK